MNNDNNNKRSHRTLEQIKAETEARLASLRERLARKDAKNDPTMQSLMEQREFLQKQIRECKKILGEGPQSAKVRAQKHQAWIDLIRQEATTAEMDLEVLQSNLERLDENIQSKIAAMTIKDSQASC
jgi:uncharacterized protein involved in exopolysaccharide biosynthesis